MQHELEKEITVRDVVLKKEQALIKKLKAEIVRAKDVLMSSEMSLKAHDVFK